MGSRYGVHPFIHFLLSSFLVTRFRLSFSSLPPPRVSCAPRLPTPNPNPAFLQPLKENRFRIPKSRYGSVSLYISDVWMNRPEYNDIDATYDEAIFDRLRKHGKS